LLTQAESRARELLTQHQEALSKLTSALLEEETISGDQVRALVEGAVPVPLAAACLGPAHLTLNISPALTKPRAE
jgi:hypothetical protein